MPRGNDSSGQDRQSKNVESERMFRILVVLGIGIGIVILSGLILYAYDQYFNVGSPTISPNEPTLAISPTSRVDRMPTDIIPTDTPMPKLKATLTSQSPNIDLTATDACAWFISIFPGTPCPSINWNDLKATATESCVQFMELFPGTPCP